MNYAEHELIMKIADLLYSGRSAEGDMDLKALKDVFRKPSRVFVYGTLRQPGKETSILHGYRLESVACAHHAFPVVVPDPDHDVIGNIVEYTPDELLAADEYEGCGRLYGRKRVEVTTGSEKEKVWIYVPMNDSLLSTHNKVIHSGDWNNRHLQKEN